MRWRRRTTRGLLTGGSPKHVTIAYSEKANATAAVLVIFAFAVNSTVIIEPGIGYVQQPCKEEQSRLRPHLAQSTPMANNSAHRCMRVHHKLPQPQHLTPINAVTFRPAYQLHSHYLSYIMDRRRTSLSSSMFTKRSLDRLDLPNIEINIHKGSSIASRIETCSSASTSLSDPEGCRPQA